MSVEKVVLPDALTEQLGGLKFVGAGGTLGNEGLRELTLFFERGWSVTIAPDGFALSVQATQEIVR